MVQLGNFHIGRGETAKPPTVDSGEAFLLWDHLILRYDIIEMTQIYQNFTHDPEFAALIKGGLAETLERQVDLLEKEMNTFQLPLPPRPPKSVRAGTNTTMLDDRFIFRQIFLGIQSFLDSHVRTIRSIITNDPLRRMFIRFAKEELDIFDNLCKYGKLKGWLEVPPMRVLLQ
ncbi:MAG: DUF3231 family protein [Firmicutes bacterium]|nr:DUF3231 family protein [Bacillota bacterium]